MEKQQWLHTLSPLRFPEIPEAVPKEGKQPSCIIGVVFTRSVTGIDSNIAMTAASQSTCCRQAVALIRRLTRRARARA